MAHAPSSDAGTIQGPRPVEHAHPGPREYVRIAVILAIVTAAEVALYYVEGIPDVWLFVTLMVMSGAKFWLVAMWFMHLRFDAPIFRRLFVGGIVLASLVYMVVLLTFRVLTPLGDIIARIGG